MLSCIYLSILVSMTTHMPDTGVQHELHTYLFCEPRQVTDVPLAGLPLTECERAANMYLFALQHAGLLPGAAETITYRATCTTTI